MSKLVVTKDIGAADVFSDVLGVADNITPKQPIYYINFSLYTDSAWSGTVTVQRSFDGGVTWLDVESYTEDVERVIEDPERSALYRAGIKTGNYTSGGLTVRLCRDF